jgi:hypothetical protein
MSLAIEAAELWTLTHGRDAVRCVAAPHPMGVEVRYVINEHPLMSRVLDDWTDVAGLAQTWRRRLEADGWVPARRRGIVRH